MHEVKAALSNMKFCSLGDMPADNLIDNTTISCNSLLIFDAAQVAYISKLERLVSSKCTMICLGRSHRVCH